MRFVLQTFGCKSNQYESQAIRESLLAEGFEETSDPAEADAYIINSCAVTSRAGASCRNAARKAIRANKRLHLVATGCAVDAEEDWPEKLGFHAILANAQKHGIADLLLAHVQTLSPALPEEDRFGLAISSFHRHTRAFLKIQDGCDNHCSYCVVPKARGRPESRPSEDILAEAARLVAAGHPEIALTGINIGVYRHQGLNLAGLTLRLAQTPGLRRLRLGSIEPQEVTEDLLLVMRDHDVVCPHLHLPLQSGDAGVLAAMNRRYRPGEFLDKVELARKILDQPAITTDVIVGFPGEDEAAFRNTLALCREAAFSRMHVFLFSARPGTPAAAMERRVPDGVVEKWKQELLELGDTQAAAFALSRVGTVERAIAETAGCLTDRYLRVRLSDRKPRPGETLRIRITGAHGAMLAGEMDF